MSGRPFDSLTITRPRHPGRTTALALGWAVVVGVLTLRPAPEAVAQVARTPWTCLVCGEAGSIDVLQNLLLFLPFGIAARRLGWGWARATAVALLGSVGIELAQAWLIVGRDPALGDVVANTVGGAGGWAIGGRILAAAGRPRGASATLGSATILLAMSVLFAATPWLLSPLDSSGLALHARAGTAIAPDGWSAPVEQAALQQRGDTTTLVVTTHWIGRRGIRREPIARIEAGDGTLWAAVDRRATSIGAEHRLWTSVLRLRTPVIAAPTPRLTAGAPVTMRSQWIANHVTLAVVGATDSTRVAGRLGPQHGWVLFTPFTARYDFAGSWQAWTLAWLVGWGALLGWFAGGMTRRWAVGVAAMAVLLATSGRAGVPVRPLEAAAFVVAWATASAGSAARARRSPGEA